MKPVDLARKLRRDAAFEPAALDRGKTMLMAAIRQEVEPSRRPTIVPQVPYRDVSAALSFLERAFGFREILTARLVSAGGVIDHAMLEFGAQTISQIGTWMHSVAQAWLVLSLTNSPLLLGLINLLHWGPAGGL